MNLLRVLYLTVFSLLFISCEELIEVDLNDTNPKLVIEAEITNSGNKQEIIVSRTVNFAENKPYEPIVDALVILSNNQGKSFQFTHDKNGIYVSPNLMSVNTNDTYFLTVEVDGQQYSSTSKMADYVEIDSIGVTKEEIFGDSFYFINMKFQDPAGVPNYYKYNVSINGGAFKFSGAYRDKFYDGKQITQQIGGQNLDDFKLGDEVIVRRSSISKETYKYWSEVQAANPGNAAPGNPTSNISNGALGYFSISNAKDYSVNINDPLE
ncbi:MAG: DUF4249 domain-containing protein [Sphingobacterium sp.]